MNRRMLGTALPLAAGWLALGCGQAANDEPLGTLEAALTTVSLQAENASFTASVVESQHAGYTGSGYVNNNNAVGSSITWTINAPAAGSALLSFRYANSGSARPVSINVNGTVVNSSFSFPATGSWTTWSTREFTANLVQGNNTVRLTSTTSNGGPNYDRLDATLPDAPPTASWVWPVAGDIGSDWVVNNYVDLLEGPGILNYTGAAELAYDGHLGTDIDIPTMRQMHDGSSLVLAAGPGTVTWVDDGYFDRQMVPVVDMGTPWNVVEIQHDNGIHAYYGHLKQDSATVAINDRVTAGQPIGVVGSSGNSSHAHLHFELFDSSWNVVCPFESGLFASPPSYTVPPTLMEMNVKVGGFGHIDQRDPPPNITSIERGQVLGVSQSVAGGQSGQTIRTVLVRPNGTQHFATEWGSLAPNHTWWFSDFSIDASQPIGTWTLRVFLAGGLATEYSITVTGSSPPPNQYQAENGTWSRAVVETEYAGYSGTGYVNTDNVNGSWMQWTVTAASAGPRTIAVRYALAGSARTAALQVNGTVVNSNLSFAGTGSWTTWATRTVTVNLVQGTNTIRFTGNTSASCPNFDRLDLQ